jgi:DNA-binding transcriptional ArsR family regulator
MSCRSISKGGNDMQEPQARAAGEAISRETRRRILRRLVAAAADGLPAGAIGAAVGCRASRLSAHLTHPVQAGWIEGRCDGRPRERRLTA